MSSVLEGIKARITAEAAAKEAAAAAEAEKTRAEAEAVAHRAGLRDCVRAALHLSTDSYSALAATHKEKLQGMVEQNKNQVSAGLGEVQDVFAQAAEIGHEISADEAQEARVEAIKGGTVSGLKEQRDEMRLSDTKSKLSAKLAEQFNDMSDEEIAETQAALESDDAAALKRLSDLVAERVAASKATEQTENKQEVVLENQTLSGKYNSARDKVNQIARAGNKRVEELIAQGSDRITAQQHPDIVKFSADFKAAQEVVLQTRDALVAEFHRTEPKTEGEMKKVRDQLVADYKAAEAEYKASEDVFKASPLYNQGFNNPLSHLMARAAKKYPGLSWQDSKPHLDQLTKELRQELAVLEKQRAGQENKTVPYDETLIPRITELRKRIYSVPSMANLERYAAFFKRMKEDSELSEEFNAYVTEQNKFAQVFGQLEARKRDYINTVKVFAWNQGTGPANFDADLGFHGNSRLPDLRLSTGINLYYEFLTPLRQEFGLEDPEKIANSESLTNVPDLRMFLAKNNPNP